jgi:hypothetical protein
VEYSQFCTNSPSEFTQDSWNHWVEFELCETP